MGLIGQVTLINQNMHVASTVAADHVAREVVSEEIKQITAKEKEDKVKKIKEVEKVEKILPDDDSKEDIEREIKHLDIKV